MARKPQAEHSFDDENSLIETYETYILLVCSITVYLNESRNILASQNTMASKNIQRYYILKCLIRDIQHYSYSKYYSDLPNFKKHLGGGGGDETNIV